MEADEPWRKHHEAFKAAFHLYDNAKTLSWGERSLLIDLILQFGDSADVARAIISQGITEAERETLFTKFETWKDGFNAYYILSRNKSDDLGLSGGEIAKLIAIAVDSLELKPASNIILSRLYQTDEQKWKLEEMVRYVKSITP